MNKALIFLVCNLMLISYGRSTDSINVSNYKINVTLNHENHIIDASEEIVWRNTGNTEVDHLLLHVYYNAFRDNHSTFFIEDSDLPDFFKPKNCEWGGTDILSIKDANGQELINQCKYVNTDTKNTNDKTVFYIPLKTKVKPNSTTSINLTWRSKVPYAMVRTGYSRDFYFFAQWFPKLGVYEKKGMRYAETDGWNCHEYHSMGEYYSDFGSYEVTMTVPKDFNIACTGNKIKDEIVGNKRIVVSSEKNIIDFAWAASPSLKIHTKRWNDKVNIIYAGPEDHEEMKHRHINSVMNALDYMTKYVGEYPYKSLTIIDPPMYGTFCSGMEYPTLITTMLFKFLPTGFKSSETLTTHEFIHQYFMQLVATNEQEEPWMDEGITTYYEGRIMDHYWGKESSLIDVFGYKIGNVEYNRGEYFASNDAALGDNTLKSWEFPSGSYGPISYNKSAMWIKTLEGMIGRNVMDEIMIRYFDHWKFKHPCTRDFIQIVNEVVVKHYGNKYGENMDWYFDQTLRSNMFCDYEIQKITPITSVNHTGLLQTIDSCLTNNSTGSSKYQNLIRLRRNENMKLPLEIIYHFEDGTKKIEYLDGNFYEKDILVSSSSPLIKSVIDPEGKLHMDKNIINNTYIVGKNAERQGCTSLLVSHRFAEFIDYLTLIF